MLSSVKFLCRVELPPANAKPGSIYRLSGLELASRLSFFLWSSIPDEELLTAGADGKLTRSQLYWSADRGACWPIRAQKR